MDFETNENLVPSVTQKMTAAHECVSVVIPAHNAAATLSDALESLIAQTFDRWEAIIVNNGSADQTAYVAARYASQDPRILSVHLPHRGVSAARNMGAALARFDWLLFLDADDWLAPRHLQKLTSALASDPALDAVHCSWARVTGDRRTYVESCCEETGDLFARLAGRYPFAIHACLVRRSLVETVGGFDATLSHCEDWDFWQRVARTGAVFGRVNEVLCYYRIRPDSASLHGSEMLAHGLQVISQGHSADPRLVAADPTHRDGQPAGQLSGKKLLWACWCAGLAIGRDQDPLSYLGALRDDRDPALEPRAVAQNIFDAVPLSRCRPLSDWHLLWQGHEARINRFLEALEAHSTTDGLARRAHILLQRSILEHAATVRPLTIGTIHAVRIEVTEPITDILPPASAERLHVTVELEGQSIGVLELPVCDGRVSGGVLRDAISAQFAWPVLGRYFERTVYPHLRIAQEPTGLALYRGTLQLAAQLAEGPQLWTRVHDRIGWTIFLQELWARPDWSQHVFYNPQAKDKLKKPERRASGDWITIEVSEELADLAVSGNAVNVVLAVGGAAIGVIAVPAHSRKIAAQTLRAALISESGFELCRAAVREGLLGRPMADGRALRERLADAAAKRRQQDIAPLTAAAPDLVTGSGRAVGQLLRPSERATLLGCRTQEAIGTSASRWAQLPSGTAAELTEAARSVGEPVIDMPGSDGPPRHVLYAPDLILCTAGGQRQAPTPAASSSGAREKDARLYDRNHFEGLFASKVDYWDYTNAYEQTKYEQTLSLLPPGRIGRTLELGCAEGHFTAQLAPHVDSLIAADISQIALARAMQRCSELKQVQFRHLDLLKDPLPGCFDLIVCSEMLYYVGDRQNLATVARKFVNALEPEGYLLTAHANLVIDEPDKPGFDWDHPFGAKVIGETFANASGLCLLKELRTPLYRIQLFRRRSRWHLSGIREAPEVMELAQPVALPPEVEKSVLWSGGSPRRGSTKISICTERLPILRYHRVAPTGSANTSRWRVTPEAFENHLRYLRDAGFYGATLEQWRQAMAKKKPLPGRAVLMTFDDGLLDFVTYAWPKMKHYGFSATMFLAADHIGRSSRWDAVYGEELPLLGWEHIRQLQAEGVEFGSLSASHRPLTALPLAEIVQEGVRSRRILQQALGVSIRAFAYPYSDLDPAVEHLVGACGYAFGLSCRPGRSCFQDSLLALPRIAIDGTDDLRAFVTKLTA